VRTGEPNRTLARTNTSWERQAADQHFTSVALRYESLRDTDHEPVLLIRARLPDRPLVGVDIGAGTGRYTEPLRRVLPDRSWVLAADRSHAMLATCGARAADGGAVLRCEAEQLPLVDRSVDFVTTFNAVHHFDLEQFTQEVARVLRPGGHLFVYTRTPEQNAKSIWGRAFPGFLSHESRLHDETTLERVFGRLGAVEMTSFIFARCATAARLAERVRGGAYSTFRRYQADELEESLHRFLERVDGEVEWHDHNLLVHVQRPG
jgi:ubiquinone/menaquinone biosynthesis C-methylase UbiE